MDEKEASEAFRAILAEYHEQRKWLLSLIRDPLGERYFVEKSQEERTLEYQEQLGRMGTFLDFLGNPQDRFHSVHVAGTGGKGSVAMMIGSILQEAGFRVGVHISPYLQVPNEKLLINGAMISPSRFSRLVNEFRSQYETFVEKHPSLPPTYGEAWVALTHVYFAQEQVNWGVMETGMGGRYDPTNVLSPEIAVITNVDMDHVPQLGTSLPEIASHKAGIIKPDIPTVTGERKLEPLQVILEEARRKNAPLYRLGTEFSVKVRSFDKHGLVLDIRTPVTYYQGLRVSLSGFFQAENAALAVMAADLLSPKRNLKATKEQVETALGKMNFPGRLEQVQRQPLVILDAAHNPQKTLILAESMRRLYRERTYWLVMGMLATKDVKAAVTNLLPQATRVIATQPKVFGKPSIPAQEMLTLVRELNPSIDVSAVDDVGEAVKAVLREAQSDDLVLITGSLYMIGEARAHWFPEDNLLWEAEHGYES